MAEAVVSLALETLGDLLQEESRFLFGVSGEVKALQTQLTEIKCLLKDADKRQHECESVCNWIAEIRDLAYRSEDAIASYAARVSSQARGRGLTRLINRFSHVLNGCYSLHQLGCQISDIKSELARVTDNMHRYGIRNIIDGGESSASRDIRSWRRKTFPSFEIGDCFVGKEDELERLTSLVVHDENHRVISILGMGGIGKTTMAKMVYNNMTQTQDSCFDSCAWVCVTKQCRIRSVLEDVVQQLDSQNREGVSGLS